MCLAAVYGNKKDGEVLLLRNASRIDVEGDKIYVMDIMGCETEIEGKITMVDLANSIVKIDCAE